ncbi:MAG: bleomycin resistance family protein [Acidiferrobacterales bacterium]|nr:bleomycin resistance family protein [Acidiferrobacterales bacterium]
MEARFITPILNVSDLSASFDWFKRLGWRKNWDWGDPPSFGCVTSGDYNIFLCENGQGGRGKGENTTTFTSAGDEQQDQGVWMSVWVDSVDDIYKHCIENNVETTLKPEDMSWGVRELHVRHPDGHVFRISQSIEDSDD